MQILISTEERLSKEILKNILGYLGLSQFEKNVKIQTVKSEWNSSFVDCIIELYSDGKIIKGFLVEITQSTEADSRNTAAYQRLQKFIISSRYYPNYEKVIFHTEKYYANTDTSKIGLSLSYLMGIKIFNVEGDYPKNVKDLQELKNQMKGPSHNTPLKFWFDKKNSTLKISAKLEKSGSFSYDPNMGFVSSIIAILKDEVENILIVNHGLDKKHLKSKNKLYKNLLILNKQVSFQFEDEILEWGLDTTFNIPKNYYKNLQNGEKLSMIKFNNFLEERGIEILFRNISGCEREKLRIDGVTLTVPKKTPIPDLVFRDKNGEIIIIEAESLKNVKKGLEQLKTFDRFIDIIKKNLKINDTKIVCGVVTDYESNINDVNYFGNYLNSENHKLNGFVY